MIRSPSPRLRCALLLSCALVTSAARAQDDGEQCDLSCPIGQRCDADGRCVAYGAEAAAPTYPGDAPWDERDPGAYRHDGFLARVSFGVGAAFVVEDLSAPARSVELDASEVHARVGLSGLALAMALDLGYSLSDSTALQLRFAQFLLDDPHSDISGETRPRVSESSRTVWLPSVAFTYFVMPQNVYATLAAGPVLWRSPAYDGDKSLGSWGIGAALDVGVELWVGEQWGLGVAARMLAFWASGEARPVGDRETTALWPSLVATLTYH